MVKEKLEVYNATSVEISSRSFHVGGGDLVCCGQPMKLLSENTTDASKGETRSRDREDRRRFKVKVGSAPHPMEDKHWIMWVQLIADGKSYRQFLNPGDAPEALFKVVADKPVAREYCNLHGLWKA